MIFNERAIVLSRAPLGEFDRSVVIFTEGLGKLRARFIGVRRPSGRLKALSEPLVLAEYRLHAGVRTDQVRVIGGEISSSFPALRGDWRLTVRALGLAEALEAMCAWRDPNPAKLRLLASALECLERGGSPWLEAAYGLRLLDLAGLRLPPEAFERGDRDLARLLESAAWTELARIPWEPAAALRLKAMAQASVEEQAGRRLAGWRLTWDAPAGGKAAAPAVTS